MYMRLAERESDYKEYDNRLLEALLLTDQNFDHDTQATTGATTGEQFVLFYAPWCDTAATARWTSNHSFRK
jgi:hypothetical protein